jgi:aromatic ring-opening dioxygenase catalytic subunit (LigB family)
MNTHSSLMPVIFVPHGGGPLPLMDDPQHFQLTEFLSILGKAIPRPESILVITAHWEENIATISSSAKPEMIYDYYGFPPETYHFNYPAPGEPGLAYKILQLLDKNSIKASLDAVRGYDHGTFVPLMLIYPDADIPVVQLSLLKSLDPAAHIEIGKAIASLREKGVLIIGSGMPFHNMKAFFSGESRTRERSEIFASWLNETLTHPEFSVAEKEQRLIAWSNAPEAKFSHPREEHLLPLHICFGAASALTPDAKQVFSGILLNTRITAYQWG